MRFEKASFEEQAKVSMKSSTGSFWEAWIRIEVVDWSRNSRKWYEILRRGFRKSRHGVTREGVGYSSFIGRLHADKIIWSSWRMEWDWDPLDWVLELTWSERFPGHSPIGICLFVRRDEVVICHKIYSCTLVLLYSWTLGLLSRVLSCMWPNNETSPSV